MHQQRLEVEVDRATAAWLRLVAGQHGGDLSAAAAASLRQLALRHAADQLAKWERDHPDYLEAAAQETEHAFAQPS